MPRIPLADPSRYILANSDFLIAATSDVLESGRYVLGSNVERFETEFANYVGVGQCISVANGTDALELALKAIGVQGREVIIAPNAGGYSAAATMAAGGTPRWVDIDKSTLLMDPESIIGALVPATAAIVVTHLYGLAFDVDELRCRLLEQSRSDVLIVEDCAQAHGAKINGRMVGSLGDIGCFSFYPTKNLGAIGDGGALTTDSEVLDNKLRAIRQYGWQDRYVQSVPGGRNSRLDELQAAFLRRGLETLDRRNEARRSIIKRYMSAGIPVVHGSFAESERYVAHLAVCRHYERDKVVGILGEAGITTAIHYPMLDQDFPVFDHLGKNLNKVAKECVGTIYSLPCFPELRDDEVDRVIEVYSSGIW